MSNRADPNLLLELKQYGEVNIESCFNCGNCTAICPLATDETPFPRNNLRMVQLGLRDRLLQSTDPWLCYYCGECSETCPRQAEPGEAQMTMRRWLTAQYDWTGLARRFYTSERWEIGSVIFVGVMVVAAFILFHGPIVTDRVELNTFAPAHIIHILDWAMFVGLAFFLLSNVLRMYYFTMRRGTDLNIPFLLYITEGWQLVYQFATQSRWSKCEEDPKVDFLKKPLWRNHWILVAGYVTMLILIVGFLKWFQTDEIYPIWHPQRWVGYLATIALLWGTIVMLRGRIKKNAEMHRFSRPTDWMFLILLLTTTVTGILVHIFRYMGLPLATYYIYVIHLAVLVPMLVLEVPFGKWSHLAYRPVAIYLQTVKEKAATRQALEPELASSLV
jgi:ferredoxin